VDTEEVVVSGLLVEIRRDKTGKWQEDQLFIFASEEGLEDAEVTNIINYLYEEAFIMDRRINYEIIYDK
tara:strand:- start:497 stop:703 length:207 start_codon:yes stop_codon:yes gene_type:complete